MMQDIVLPGNFDLGLEWWTRMRHSPSAALGTSQDL
jgi:hypothetical protein